MGICSYTLSCWGASEEVRESGEAKTDSPKSVRWRQMQCSEGLSGHLGGWQDCSVLSGCLLGDGVCVCVFNLCAAAQRFPGAAPARSLSCWPIAPVVGSSWGWRYCSRSVLSAVTLTAAKESSWLLALA